MLVARLFLEHPFPAPRLQDAEVPPFKTLKYRPTFPERFGSIQDTRAHCHGFFAW
jgi:hypothetical protein